MDRVRAFIIRLAPLRVVALFSFHALALSPSSRRRWRFWISPSMLSREQGAPRMGASWPGGPASERSLSAHHIHARRDAFLVA